MRVIWLPHPVQVSLAARWAPDETEQRIASIVSPLSVYRRPLIGSVARSSVYVWLRAWLFPSPVEFVGAIRGSAHGSELLGQIRLSWPAQVLHSLGLAIVVGLLAWLSVASPPSPSLFMLAVFASGLVAADLLVLRWRFVAHGNRLARVLFEALESPAT